MSDLKKRKKTDLRLEKNVNMKTDIFECQTPGVSKTIKKLPPQPASFYPPETLTL